MIAKDKDKSFFATEGNVWIKTFMFRYDAYK